MDLTGLVSLYGMLYLKDLNSNSSNSLTVNGSAAVPTSLHLGQKMLIMVWKIVNSIVAADNLTDTKPGPVYFNVRNFHC